MCLMCYVYFYYQTFCFDNKSNKCIFNVRMQNGCNIYRGINEYKSFNFELEISLPFYTIAIHGYQYSVKYLSNDAYNLSLGP